MNKLDIRNITSVKTSSNHTIKARYLNIPNFDLNNKLCFELHAMFLFNSKDRAQSSGHLLNQAIENFFIFINLYNTNQPLKLKVDSLSKVQFENFKAFIRHCQKNKITLEMASKLKAAIVDFAEKTKLIPIPLLPNVTAFKSKNKPTEPLDENCYNDLTQTLTLEIDRLYEKVNFIEKVKKAEPYTLSEALLEISPPMTKERIFAWYEMILSKEIINKFTVRSLSVKLKNCIDTELLELMQQPDSTMLEKFKVIYERDKKLIDTSQIILKLRKQEGFGLCNWNFDVVRGLKTLIANGYPMQKTLDEIDTKYSAESCIKIGECEDIIQLLILRISRSPQKYKHPEIKNWDDFLGMYFPSMIDSAAIYLMLALQTGWNKETILAINPNNYEHVLSGTLNENQSIIFSEKHRSQDSTLPYINAKEFIAPSNKEDKYSIYNIIQLAKNITLPLEKYSFDYIHMHHQKDDLNPLFLCLRYWADWVSKGGRHTSISQNKAFQTAIKHFINKHKIEENGKQISAIGDLTLRLRVTWIQIKRKELPLTVIRLIQGHNTKDTTDRYYDNSGVAKQDRKRRLRIEQEKVIALLRNREFKGIIGAKANQDASTNHGLKIFHIPGQRNNLWGCFNQYEPTWNGSENKISNGEKCYSIQNCIFCKQVRLFEESVPYLMERLQHINDLMTDIYESDSTLNEEKLIIESILDNWNDDDHIRESVRYQRKNAPLLPRNLNDLKVIFEDNYD
ncbi:hypothetical protein [Acinetobacter sp. CFCC 10889]|uniref:hypothetical protein n=1 Tax=Acinetobacter sp. CFCC 10889 TaxID=1775557 RepID=UPI000DD03475|nr:hypothetical protein [Acinetobacter sp. CFCC 10889]